MSADTFSLERFIQAQAPVYPAVLSELRRGHKQSHWIWYIFPQLRGLGRSSTSQYFGISGIDEAKAYLAHPVLGARLVECIELMLTHRGVSAGSILGGLDALKFCSCLTLFLAVMPSNPVFAEALECFFDGAPDRITRDRLPVQE